MCWVLKDWFSLAYTIRELGRNVLGLKDWYSLAHTIRDVLNFKRLVTPSIYY